MKALIDHLDNHPEVILTASQMSPSLVPSPEEALAIEALDEKILTLFNRVKMLHRGYVKHWNVVS